MSLLTHAGLRRLFRRFHYWLGVALAVPFLVVAITGCLLGFGPELDHLIYADFYHPSGAGGVVSAQQVLDAARAANPLPVMSLSPPSDRSPVWLVAQGTGKGANMGVQQESSFDPATGVLIGRRDTNANPVRVIHRLHNAFLLENGRQIVGYVGLVLAFLLVSGLVVLLPPPGGWRRAAFPPKGTRGARWLLDWHTAASLWPLPIILLVTLTGLSMTFPQTSHALLGENGGHMMGGNGGAAPGHPFPVNADQAIEIALAAYPGTELQSLTPASAGHPVWRLSLRPATGLWQRRVQVMVDANSGDQHSMTPTSAAGFYLAQQHGLHGGAVLGFAGRMLVFTAGLCMTFLPLSGLLVWARRHRRRAAASVTPIALPQEN